MKLAKWVTVSIFLFATVAAMAQEYPARPVRISAVIPTFNRVRFLPEAIESALSQGPAVGEVIIVDDGSTDDTPAIASEFRTVRYVHHCNLGLSAARNTGLRAATGDVTALFGISDIKNR